MLYVLAIDVGHEPRSSALRSEATLSLGKKIERVPAPSMDQLLTYGWPGNVRDEACDWRVRGPGNAAKPLGLNASTLYSRMKKLRIQQSTATRRRGAGG